MNNKSKQRARIKNLLTPAPPCPRMSSSRKVRKQLLQSSTLNALSDVSTCWKEYPFPTKTSSIFNQSFLLFVVVRMRTFVAQRWFCGPIEALFPQHVWSYDFMQARTHNRGSLSDPERDRRVYQGMSGFPGVQTIYPS